MTWAWSRRSSARHKAGGGGYIGRHRSDFIKECGIVNDMLADDVLNRIKQLALLNNNVE